MGFRTQQFPGEQLASIGAAMQAILRADCRKFYAALACFKRFYAGFTTVGGWSFGPFSPCFSKPAHRRTYPHLAAHTRICFALRCAGSRTPPCQAALSGVKWRKAADVSWNVDPSAFKKASESVRKRQILLNNWSPPFSDFWVRATTESWQRTNNEFGLSKNQSRHVTQPSFVRQSAVRDGGCLLARASTSRTRKLGCQMPPRQGTTGAISK